MITPRMMYELMIILGLGVLSVGAQPVAGIQEGKECYQSGGRKIRVDTFLPAGQGAHPAVLVLYGSGGAVLGKGDMNDFARKLAGQGMAAYLIHYLNRTGSIMEMGDRVITERWQEWNAAVKDGVDFVCRQPGVKPGAVGIYGYSLGAFLAISESTGDKRIRAVVELSGGLFDKLRGNTRRFPPMRILHGRDDKRVPMARVPELQKEAQRFEVVPKVKIYEGEGHQLGKAAAADATERALTFLRQRL